MTSSPLSPKSSSSSSGDYVSSESCFDVHSDENDCGLPDHNHDRSFGGQHKKRHQRLKMGRELPPPIPLLGRTVDVASQVPWVLKRVYTSDGRLILREEKVRHHEYLRAHRSKGRLTLQLVRLDLRFDGESVGHDNDDNSEDIVGQR